MKLELSNAMRLARSEMQSTRSRRAVVRAEAAESARRYRDGETVSIQEVHAAEARAEAADERYAVARRRFEEKRAEFAPRFRERQAPVADGLREDLARVADALEHAIAPAREVDAFAIAHSLPTLAAIGRVNRLAHIARELHEIAR